METHLDTRDAARRLGISPTTLIRWRYVGTGPRYLKLGRSVRYAIEDLIDFEERCAVGPTDDSREAVAQC